MPGKGKKSGMRPIRDVMARIRYDDAFAEEIEDFVLGYLDRFEGVVPVPFSEYAEYEELVMHRIKWVEYKGVRVWDREARLDRVFGSTAPYHTIRDVKRRLESGEEVVEVRKEEEEEGEEEEGVEVGPRVIVIPAPVYDEVFEDDESVEGDEWREMGEEGCGEGVGA